MCLFLSVSAVNFTYVVAICNRPASNTYAGTANNKHMHDGPRLTLCQLTFVYRHAIFIVHTASINFVNLL